LKHHCEVGAHNYTAHSNVAGQPDPPLLLGCMQLPTTSETVLVVNHPHSLKPEWMATTPPVRFS
jgi:hypothetical protein